MPLAGIGQPPAGPVQNPREKRTVHSNTVRMCNGLHKRCLRGTRTHPMIDTVRLASPPVSEALAQRVAEALIIRQAVQVATGDVLYQFTSGTLAGSWDSRVSVQVERERWECPPATLREITERVTGGRKLARRTAIKVPCEPFFVVEGSVHKALVGHNVFGGPLPPALSCVWFVDDIAQRLGVSLPPGEEWTVERIDWAEAFDMGSFEAVEEFVGGLNQASFPRRRPHRYAAECLEFPGRTTTVKAYHKGPEFSKHDHRRLRDHVARPTLEALQHQANRILRLETSIKARKLVDDFGHKPLSGELTQAYLESVHDREVARLLKEAGEEMQVYRNSLAVSRRLHELYGAELGNRLYGTWMQLAAHGDKEVKRRMAARTYYWQRRKLIDAGCSWAATDVSVRSNSAIPAGFSPVRADRRRLTEEAEEVRAQLYSYGRSMPWG